MLMKKIKQKVAIRVPHDKFFLLIMQYATMKTKIRSFVLLSKKSFLDLKTMDVICLLIG